LADGRVFEVEFSGAAPFTVLVKGAGLPIETRTLENRKGAAPVPS
jgi:hypothetical protein